MIGNRYKKVKVCLTCKLVKKYNPVKYQPIDMALLLAFVTLHKLGLPWSATMSTNSTAQSQSRIKSFLRLAHSIFLKKWSSVVQT